MFSYKFNLLKTILLPFYFPLQIEITKIKLFTFPHSFNPPPSFKGVLDNNQIQSPINNNR